MRRSKRKLIPRGRKCGTAQTPKRVDPIRVDVVAVVYGAVAEEQGFDRADQNVTRRADFRAKIQPLLKMTFQSDRSVDQARAWHMHTGRGGQSVERYFIDLGHLWACQRLNRLGHGNIRDVQGENPGFKNIPRRVLATAIRARFDPDRDGGGAMAQNAKKAEGGGIGDTFRRNRGDHGDRARKDRTAQKFVGIRRAQGRKVELAGSHMCFPVRFAAGYRFAMDYKNECSRLIQ